MNHLAWAKDKIILDETLWKRKRQIWKNLGKTVVFTNGCFDLVHPGHLDLLSRAKALGDRLVLALNSDASIRGLKGESRPLVPEKDRLLLAASLLWVDMVLLFEEPTPQRLIETLDPEVLVKGGDYAPDQVVGAEWVKARGGRLEILPLLPGYSTSALAERIRNS